jgi:proteasome accessory factor B
MKRILGWLQENKFPNATWMARELNVSTKTVHRDLRFMQLRWELPIVFDSSRNGFGLSGAQAHAPGTTITEKDLFAHCIVQNAIEQYQDTPFQRPLESAFQRCLGSLNDEKQLVFDDGEDALAFRPISRNEPSLQLFELVTKAIADRRVLEFEYRKPGEQGGSGRRIHPYQLAHQQGRWYLFGYDPNRGEVSKVLVNRVHEAVVCEETFAIRNEFQKSRLLRERPRVSTDASDYDVVIEMDAWLTDVTRGLAIHPSQLRRELPGGKSVLRLRVNCLDTIEQWVLSWGTHANVMCPQELIGRVIATTEELTNRYKKMVQNK